MRRRQGTPPRGANAAGWILACSVLSLLVCLAMCALAAILMERERIPFGAGRILTVVFLACGALLSGMICAGKVPRKKFAAAILSGAANLLVLSICRLAADSEGEWRWYSAVIPVFCGSLMAGLLIAGKRHPDLR